MRKPGGYHICENCLLPNFVRHLCAKVGQNLATRPVPALNLPHCLLGCSVSDLCKVGSDLLVHAGEALAVLPADAGLLLLVDDLVEALVQEDGQSLTAVTMCGDGSWNACQASG